MTARLSFCIRAATTLHPDDLSDLTDSIETYVKTGVKTELAESLAVNDILATVKADRADMVNLLREQHPDAFQKMPQTPAQRSAAARARMKFNPETDSVLQAVAKMGGIRRVVAKEFGLKPEELKHTVDVGGLKGYPFRATGGLDLDRVLTNLQEVGYFTGVPEEDVRSKFEEAIYADLRGDKTLTTEGQMRAAQDAHNEKLDEDEAAEREALLADAEHLDPQALTDDDLDFFGTSNSTTEQGMRSLGFTEQEIADELAREKAQGSRAENAAPAVQEAQTTGRAGSEESRAASAGTEGRPDLTLTQPTRAEVLAQEAAREQELLDREALPSKPKDKTTGDTPDLFNTQASVFDAPASHLDFSGAELLPTAEAIETGPAHEADTAAVEKLQQQFRGKVNAFKSLKLTALPRLTKPAADASDLAKLRYAAAAMVESQFGNQVTWFHSNIQFANGMMADYLPGRVFINENTTRPVMAVLGHELTHSMRQSNPELYRKLADRIGAMLDEPGRYHEQLNARRKKAGMEPLDFNQLREELIADIVGDNFTDPHFWRQMTQGQPNLFNRVLRVVRDFLDAVLAKLRNERPYGTDRYLNDIQAARDAVVEAMREFSNDPKMDANGSIRTFDSRKAAQDYIDGGAARTQPGFDITDSMREKAAGGLPMFSLAPEELPPKEGLLRAFQRITQDDMNRFTVLRNWAEKQGINMTPESNVWAYEDRYKKKVANRVDDFRNLRVKPAIQAIQKAGFTMPQVAEFLHAQHAEERNNHIEQNVDKNEPAGSGMTTEAAREILAKADPKLASLANDFRKITKDTKDILLKAGIVNTEMTSAWEGAYEHYVPLKGGEEATQTGTGKRLNIAGKQKRAMGHGQRDEHILENIIRDHERAIQLAEKNVVFHSLLSFIADIGNPNIATIGEPVKRKVLKKTTDYEVMDGTGSRVGIFDSLEGANKFIKQHSGGLFNEFGTLTAHQVQGDPSVAYMASPMLADNEVQGYVNGYAIRVQLNDEKAAQAYTGSGIVRLNRLFALNREINGYLSKAYTGYNPTFLITNPIRDAYTGTVNLVGNYGATVAARAVAGYPKALASLLRYVYTGQDTPSIKAYRANGGALNAHYLPTLEQVGTDMQDTYDEFRGVIETAADRGTVAAARAAARKVAGASLGWLANANKAVESAFRLATFESVRTTPGYTDEDAATAANNVTVNFDRRGEFGQVLSSMYLFYNPKIQGAATLLDTLINGKHKGQAWALISAMPMLAYLLAATQFGGGADDDQWWLSIPDSVKDQNLIFRTGKRSYIAIPIGQDLAFIHAMGNAIYALQKGRDVNSVGINMASNILGSLSPIGNPIGDTIEPRGLTELVPGLFGGELMRDVARIAANRSGLGGDIVPGSTTHDQSKPDNLKMFRGTKGTAYEAVAKGLNARTGGTAATSGGIDVSPESLKFWVKVLTGGTGSFLSDATDLARRAATKAANPSDPDKEALNPSLHETPVVSRFVKEETVQDRRRMFWDAVKKVDETREDLRRTRQLHDTAGQQSVWNQRAELIAMGGYTEAQKNVVKRLRDQIDGINADTTTTLAHKRSEVQRLEEIEKRIYTDYVRSFTMARSSGDKQRAEKKSTAAH